METFFGNLFNYLYLAYGKWNMWLGIGVKNVSKANEVSSLDLALLFLRQMNISIWHTQWVLGVISFNWRSTWALSIIKGMLK